MSSNLNFNKGRVSFVSAIEPAWHKSGTILDHKMTSAEAIEFSNMDYSVELAPLYAKFSDDKNVPQEQRGVKIDTHWATYRQDNLDILGVVGSKYEVIQNKEVFSFFDTIIKDGDAIYETAGVLGKGETIFLTAKLPSYIVLPGEDLIEKYILLTSSHDGSGATTALFTPTRVVCANTLALALKNGSSRFSIKHTKNAHDRILEAAKLMGLVNQSSEQLEIALKAMSTVRVNQDQLIKYVSEVFLTKPEMEALAKFGTHGEHGISTRKVNTINSVMDYVSLGVGQDTLSTKGTLFGAYSAITGYFQNSKEYKNTDSKMKSLIFEGTDFKSNKLAFDLACNYINVF